MHVLSLCPFQREGALEGKNIELQVGTVVGRVGPSMLLTSASESLAFFLGKVIARIYDCGG